jgi:hypothetical protein
VCQRGWQPVVDPVSPVRAVGVPPACEHFLDAAHLLIKQLAPEQPVTEPDPVERAKLTEG